MSKKVYFASNVIIFLIFVIFYLIPGIDQGGWISSLVKNVPLAYLICITAIGQFCLAFILFEYKKLILKYLNRYEFILKKRWFYIVLTIIFALFFFSLGVKRYYNLQTGLFDFGLEHQVVWNTSQGRWFGASVEVNNYLADHVSLLTVIPAALYRIIPSPLLLIALQSICVLISAIAIKKIADRELKKPLLSLAIYLMFIFYIGVSGLLLDDYHPVVLSLPFLAWGIYLMESERFRKLAIVLLIIGAFGKEDMAIFVGALGLYYWLVRKRLKTGIPLAIFGFLWGALCVAVIIPFLRGAPSDTLARYGGLSIIFSSLNLKGIYIIRLLFPVLFVVLLAPNIMWVLIPNLAINLVSGYPGQLSAVNQYDIATSIIIFISLIEFLKRRKAAGKALYYILALLLIVNLMLLSGHLSRRYLFTPVTRYSDYTYLHNLMDNIPSNAIIAVTNSVGGQFGEFQHVQIFDDTIKTYTEEPDYIIIDRVADFTLTTHRMMDDRLANGYIIRNQTQSFFILQRVIMANVL